MSTYIERAADLLFPAEGRQTLNIKFFGVADGRVSAASLAEQILRAEAQITAGNAVYVEDVDADLT
ncbi:hypothetical protein [Novosphingobium sp. MD-1]|uniref:hypothetical protein n=1 Tax=Novosphingobium sp. MD-1 TaxID=1630648 RepID=UPI000F7E8C8C|nr:hypothetical protein [Novosphingobium sp. MD-1]